jgi:hypothetical protein
MNTATNLGAAIGTALAGSILVTSLTSAFLQDVEDNNSVPPQVTEQAQVNLANGVPFLSDADLPAALDQAGVPPDVSEAGRAPPRRGRRAVRRTPHPQGTGRRPRPNGPADPAGTR